MNSAEYHMRNTIAVLSFENVATLDLAIITLFDQSEIIAHTIGTGWWEGKAESTAMVMVRTSLAHLDSVRPQIARLASEYEQYAIGVTVAAADSTLVLASEFLRESAKG